MLSVLFELFRKQKPLTKLITVLVAVVGFLAALIEVVKNWSTVQDIINAILALIASFLSSPIPLWVFPLFIALLILSVIGIRRRIRIPQTPKITRTKVKFRDVWLILDRTEGEPIPVVVNDEVNSGKCAKTDNCNGRLVSTDTGNQRTYPIHYLKCEFGHYVGSALPYEAFIKRRNDRDKLIEQKELELKQKFDAEIAQKQKDRDEGRITETEFQEFMESPAPELNPVTYFMMGIHETTELGDNPPTTREGFYRKLVMDYQNEYVRKVVNDIPTN